MPYGRKASGSPHTGLLLLLLLQAAQRAQQPLSLERQHGVHILFHQLPAQ
jgi:hypothetical protein